MGNIHSSLKKCILNKTSQRSSTVTEKHKESNSPRTSLPPSPLYTIDDEYKTDTIIVNGRRYQNYNTKYVLPNDNEEQDRLVQAHFIYKYLFNGNFSAPVNVLLSDPPKQNSFASCQQVQPRVLDLACGNGTWTLEMATEFKSTQFYGLDISPNYPTSIKPPNTIFMQYDILNPKGLPFPDEYFDFVFMRQVYTCFSRSDWTIIVHEIRRILKPGCFLECRDIYPILRQMGPKTQNFFKKYPELMKERHGVDIDWAECMHQHLSVIGGFSDMQNSLRTIYCGKTGPISAMMNNSLKSGLLSYRLFFQTSYNISPEDYDQLVDAIVEESVDYKSYFNYYASWGRKPLSNLSLASNQTPSYPSSLNSNRSSLDNPPHIFGCDSVSDINEFINGYEE